MAEIISVVELEKSYGETEALRGLSFEVGRGEVFALLGPNGAGKTTTVEILEGFRRRSGGQVRVLGVDPERADRHLRSRIGIMLQDTWIEPDLTVRECLAWFGEYYPRTRPTDELLELVGLRGKHSARVRTLSGGQRRRLDLALGLVGRPELIFLDEPTTGFDPEARRQAWDVLANLRSTGTTVLLTTHYMDEVQYLADRVAVVAGGRIVASGTPASLGGRDEGTAMVSFRLPVCARPADLPRLDGVYLSHGCPDVSIATDHPTCVLRALTDWAVAFGGELEGLTVSRQSLEDAYLQLLASTPAAAQLVEAGR